MTCDELVAARGALGNFASFLRANALRCMPLQAHHCIPPDAAVPIRSLDSHKVLERLS